MNKGSHISLAHFLMDDINLDEFKKNEKAFMVGSILPDCLPSFLTTRHTITETFGLLKAEIEKVYNNFDMEKGMTSYYSRHLGIICHYLADYFTFPHNPGFKGSVKEHINYEKELFIAFQVYLKNRTEYPLELNAERYTVNDICSNILDKHKLYMNTLHDIRTDCSFIVEICTVTMKIILDKMFLKLPIEQVGEIQAA